VVFKQNLCGAQHGNFVSACFLWLSVAESAPAEEEILALAPHTANKNISNRKYGNAIKK